MLKFHKTYTCAWEGYTATKLNWKAAYRTVISHLGNSLLHLLNCRHHLFGLSTNERLPELMQYHICTAQMRELMIKTIHQWQHIKHYFNSLKIRRFRSKELTALIKRKSYVFMYVCMYTFDFISMIFSFQKCILFYSVLSCSEIHPSH